MASDHTPASLSRLAGLTLGAVGVVYGDIGTSPLYAFRESVAATLEQTGSIDADSLIGITSLVIWSLILVVTLKYVVTLLRADNHGEGGILSLMTLALQGIQATPLARFTPAILMMGMTGASMFYGDAIITPAISVLSAMEGLELVTHAFTPFILPLAVVVILALFLMQARGTEKIARFFGPVMLLWFLAIAAGGLIHIQDSPAIWGAFNPVHALNFMTSHGYASVIILGAVVLTVTGAEALYADLGHFGKRPIRAAWFLLVMPALMLNYLGQGALIMARPEAAENPFFLLYPDWALLPMVILATCATVIASQAVITGAFSVTRQAVSLNLLPRFHIRYTSATQSGQIYMPKVNWLLLTGVLLLIALFRTSANLASAYGIAVTGTMVMAALLLFIVMRHHWRWHTATALIVILPLLAIDLAFFGANCTKLLHGGYMPLVLSVILIIMMSTWRRGSSELQRQTHRHHYTLDVLREELSRRQPRRITGTAVFMTSDHSYAPSALLQNLKHNQVLHDQNILLTLCFETTPAVPDENRIRIEPVDRDFTRIFLHYGYMETPNITRSLALLRSRNIRLDMMHTTFFISRRNIMPSAIFGMPLWRDRIFIALYEGASDAADYFHIPSSRVVELGVQVTV